MVNQNIESDYEAVKRLIREKLDWLPIVEACLEIAKQVEGKDFAGSWVFDKAESKGVSWFPNLKPLVSYGILTRTAGSRGGRRAYYSMPDMEVVESALKEIYLK